LIPLFLIQQKDIFDTSLPDSVKVFECTLPDTGVVKYQEPIAPVAEAL
jgi:hypothetical protein